MATSTTSNYTDAPDSDAALHWIAAPDERFFRDSFDEITPPVSFLNSSLGRTAFYLLEGTPLEGSAQQQHSSTPPIVLIHGVCTPALGMLPIAYELQKRRPTTTILLFDIWGHGMSSSPKIPHSTSIVDQQLEGLLRHLNWSRVDVLGYSLGGSLAVSFATSSFGSTLVRSLFLLAPVGLLRVEEFKQDLEPDDIIVKTRSPKEEAESTKRILDWLEGAPTIVVPEDWRQQISKGRLVAPAIRQWQRDNHAGHIGSIVSYFRNNCPFNADDAFHTIVRLKLPSRILLGERDDCCTAAHLERVGLQNHYTIPNSTHGLARDNVSEVVDELVAFLDTLESHKSSS